VGLTVRTPEAKNMKPKVVTRFIDDPVMPGRPPTYHRDFTLPDGRRLPIWCDPSMAETDIDDPEVDAIYEAMIQAEYGE